ncbi:hypothetical protein KJ671_00605 [Patescibacteria group bacterium]|nr:hypothetical protein [Patescibacteria group bacterium]
MDEQTRQSICKIIQITEMTRKGQVIWHKKPKSMLLTDSFRIVHWVNPNKHYKDVYLGLETKKNILCMVIEDYKLHNDKNYINAEGQAKKLMKKLFCLVEKRVIERKICQKCKEIRMLLKLRRDKGFSR